MRAHTLQLMGRERRGGTDAAPALQTSLPCGRAGQGRAPPQVWAPAPGTGPCPLGGASCSSFEARGGEWGGGLALDLGSLKRPLRPLPTARPPQLRVPCASAVREAWGGGGAREEKLMERPGRDGAPPTPPPTPGAGAPRPSPACSKPALGEARSLRSPPRKGGRGGHGYACALLPT